MKAFRQSLASSILSVEDHGGTEDAVDKLRSMAEGDEKELKKSDK